MHDYRKTVRQSTGDARGAANAHNTSKNKSNKIPQDHNKRGSRAGRRRSQHQQQQLEVLNIEALLPTLMKELGTHMEARMQECAVSDDNAACADRCFQELQGVLVELGPRWRVEVFGSVANGFRTSTSDMDATCVQAPDEDGQEAHPIATTVLQERLLPLLRQHEQFQVIEEIFNAKVPILRLRFEGHLDIDLSCQNTAALLNTRLLSAYANLHPRVRELGIAVKLWAKAAHVCGAAQGNLSSYSFTLLVIYFMQVHHEVNLPCLPTSLFEAEDPGVAAADLETIRNSWSCELSLADLFFRFIGFYNLFFDWGREVVSARFGRRTHSQNPAFSTLRGRYVSRLHIEDPYAIERNLHCVLGEAEEVQLREAFHAAWLAMIQGGTPVGLRPLGIGGNKIEIQLDKHTPFSNSAQATFHDTHSKANGSDDRFKVAESPMTFSSSGSTESGDDSSATRVPSSSSGESRQSDDDCMTVDKDVAASNWWQNLASANVHEAVSTSRHAPENHQPKERPRVISLEDLENRMAQEPIGPVLAPTETAQNGDEYRPSAEPQDHLRELAQRILNKVKRTQASTCDSVFFEHSSGVPQRAAFVGAPESTQAPSTSMSASLPAEGDSMWWKNLGSANVKQVVEASGQEEEGGRWSRRKRGLRQGVTVQDLEVQMIQESPQDFGDPDSKEAWNPAILPLIGGSFVSTSSGKIASRIASKCLSQA